MLITKALLHLAFELGGVFGQTWATVLEVLQRLDAALFERGVVGGEGESASKASVAALPGSPMTAAGWIGGRLDTELVRLRASLDLLFEQVSETRADSLSGCGRGVGPVGSGGGEGCCCAWHREG